MAFKQAASGKIGCYIICRKGAAHKNFAMGEIDHAQDTINQGVAHGYQSVYAPLRQTINNEIEPLDRSISARTESQDRAQNYKNQQGKPDRPHHNISCRNAFFPSLKLCRHEIPSI